MAPATNGKSRLFRALFWSSWSIFVVVLALWAALVPDQRDPAMASLGLMACIAIVFVGKRKGYSDSDHGR